MRSTVPRNTLIPNSCQAFLDRPRNCLEDIAVNVNPPLNYLADLTVRLATGLEQVPVEMRQRHTDYILSVQGEDGGFPGRMGGSDLYYTSFALRSLAVLGELQGELAERAAEFVRSRLSGRESLIDLMSLVFSTVLLDMAAGIDVLAHAATDWRQSLADRLNELRCEDGGFAKGAGGAAGSTYHTFLVLLCLELIDHPVEDEARVVEFLHSQRAVDGGFREIRASKRAGTNPTAAAIGALQMLNALDDDVRGVTVDFLLDMQNDEGGLLANSRIPIADILSTFTGLVTLQDLGGADRLDRKAMRRFVSGANRADGGFHAAVWDEACDVEYTFYGLGCLALLGGTEG